MPSLRKKSLYIAKILMVTLNSVLASIFNIGCTTEKPGEGEKAERGFALLNPVIVALEKYHKNKNTYPETIEELVPEYINSIPTEYDGAKIVYEKISAHNFRLTFRYHKPGFNECTYTPENTWKCFGHY